MNTGPNKSRFCYSYKPPGVIDNCCTQPVCTTNQRLELISSLQMVTFNSTKTSERSLLLAEQQQCLVNNSYKQTASTVQATLANTTAITGNLVGQLLQLKQDRYQPYQPYIPPVMPQNVIEFQMATANAGVPHSFFTVANCKGVQSVTT
jgi:hypothetical protein